MNKTTGIIVAVVVLILLGGGAFYLLGKSNKAPMQSGQTANTQNQTQQASTQKKSLFDFFSMAGSQKCAFSDTANGGSGTVYISSGKMRGDFHSSDNGKTNTTQMINDGKFVYFWTEGENSGYKMPLDFVKKEASQVSMAPDNSSSQQTPSQAVDMKQQSNYTCGPWSADAAMFAVPTNITFADYSSMMQGAMKSVTVPASAQGNKAACSQCDKLPAGAAQTQCRTALKC